MVDRTLAVRVSADVAQFQQAMSQAQSSLHSFQQALGASGSAVHGFQSAASGAASAAHQVGSAQQQAASQVNQANSQIVSSNTNSANSFGQFARRAVAIVGVGAAFKSTIKIGMDFQSSLNTMGAVSHATAAQMVTVADTARALGKDISIPGASAADAAAAMTELAKGGLSVDQAMQAAKGTLQLAAAAQIDGAQAAEIQARAINTFGLAGKDASHVGDVLANTANAATGDITDFAAALSQGGLVAHSMGINIDDTSTALGIFANQGLIGSDAGTSLKTMLVQLQSPTKKQADALKVLGLNAFDAQGNFVGMRTVTDELSAAQGTLTQQQFDAAASTAFGTDGVRAAIAMAAGGTAAYDKMSAAVGRSGGAADLAGAKMKGLKGAFSQVQNSVQDAQLALMEKLSPALEAGTKQFADMIPSLTTSLVPALGTIGNAVLGIAQTALPMLSSAASAIAPLFTAAASGIGAIMPMFKGIVGIIGGAAKVFAGLPGPVHAAVLAMLAMRLVRGPLSSVGSAAGTVGTQIKLMGQQFATLRLAGMGSAVSAAAVGLRSMGTAARGLGRSLSGAFGGPIGLAIVAITTALSIFSNRNKEAHDRVAAHKQAIVELAQTMDKASGQISQATKDAVTQDFTNVAPAFDAIGLKAGDAAQAIIKMQEDGGVAAQKFREQVVNKINFDDVTKRLSNSGVDFVTQFSGLLNMSAQDIMKIVDTGGKGADDLQARLVSLGAAPQFVTDGFNRLRGDTENVVSTFAAFMSQQDGMAASMRLSADGVKTLREQLASAAGVDFAKLNGAMDSAVVGGKDLESTFAAFGFTGPQVVAVLKAMGENAFKGGDGLHYMSQAQADAAAAAADAAPKVENLSGAAKKADDAAKAAAASADVWKKAVADAKPPTDGLKAALDETKAAADAVTTAADFMAAAILRASGHDVDAATAQREQAAAMRAVTEGIYEKVRAGEDDRKATENRVQAENDLAAARSAGRKKDETDAAFATRIADLTDKVAGAKRGEQDAHLKNAAAQTADVQGYEKAAAAAARSTAAVTNTRLATGSYSSALRVGQAEMAKQRQAFINSVVAARGSGESMDAARKRAAELANQYGLTPTAVRTAFTAEVAAAKRNGDILIRTYDKTTGTWTAHMVTAGDARSRAAAGETVQAYDRARGVWTGNITAKNQSALDKIKATQDAVDALTGKAVSITYQGVIMSSVTNSGQNISKAYAHGGLLHGPGTGTSDSINAKVSDGEFITNARATTKHLPLLRAINDDVPAFASGGLFGRSGKNIADYKLAGPNLSAGDFAKLTAGAIQKIAPTAGAALKVAMEAMALSGGGFSIGSGNWGPPNLHGLAANTLAAENFVKSHFGINNIGGWSPSGSVATSDHPKGKAIDVMIDKWRTAAGIAEGNKVAAYFTGHPNDFGTKYAIWRNRIDTGSGWRPYTRSDRGNISDPTLAHMDHVHVSFLSGPSGPMQGAGGGGGGAAVPAGSAESRWYPLMHRIIAAKGFSQTVFPIMAKQMHMESSGNPRAINLWDSNARAGHPSKGLLQFIDSTFAQYADPGHNTNIWDPESQIRAFLNYVPARYSRGFQHLTDIGNRAYARGGRLDGPGTGTSDSLNIRASKGEFLTNARATAKHLPLLEAINRDVPAYAAGGRVGTLAGLAPRQAGTREGIVLGGIDELSAAIRGLRDAANAASDTYRTAAKDFADAQIEAARTAATGRSDVAAARADLRATQADQGRNVAKTQTDAARSVADAAEKRRATLLQARAELNTSSDRHKAYADYVAADRATMLDLQRAQQDAGQSTRDAILQQRREIAAAADKLRATQIAANADNQSAAAKVAAANRIRKSELQLAKATDARADRAAALQRSESRLVWTQSRLGQKFDQLTGQLGDARDKLSGLRGDKASQAASLGSSIGNYDSGILGQTDTRRSPADIIRGMTFDLSKVSKFTNNLSVLKGKGLSGGLLEQIASAGVDGGGTTAAALSRASKVDIARINALQKSTEKWANVGGGLVAGANFDPLIASQATLVTKLSTYTAQVDGAMRAIANALNAMDVKLVIDPQGIARLVNRGNVLLGRR